MGDFGKCLASKAYMKPRKIGRGEGFLKRKGIRVITSKSHGTAELLFRVQSWLFLG